MLWIKKDAAAVKENIIPFDIIDKDHDRELHRSRVVKILI